MWKLVFFLVLTCSYIHSALAEEGHSDWSLSIDKFSVQVTEKGESTYRCADDPKVLLEKKDIEFTIDVSGKGNYFYDLQILRTGFARKDKDLKFFDRDFDEKKGKNYISLNQSRRFRSNTSSSQTIQVPYEIRPLQSELGETILTAIVSFRPAYAVDDEALKVTKQLQIKVYRPYRLLQYDDPNMSCSQIYKAKTCSGYYCNQNDRDLDIALAIGRSNSESEREARSDSWAFAPVIVLYGIGVGFGNFAESYMREMLREHSSTFTITSNNIIDPGSKGFIYKQKTRHIEGFKVVGINYCGDQVDKGNVFVQTETYAYNVFTGSPLESQTIGEPESNSCQAIDEGLNNYSSRVNWSDHLKTENIAKVQ